MNKYNNTPATVDGIRFDSKREAQRYQKLNLLYAAGEIHRLAIHPRYVLLDPFTVKGVKYRGITYEADFEYIENGVTVVEDVKGKRTAVFNLKEKLFLNRYGDQYDFRITP